MDKKTMERMEEIVFSYPKISDRISKKPDDRKAILKNLYEIAADFSPRTMGPFIKILGTAISKLYDSIKFNSDEKIDFVKLVKENNVVLVPNHQSHFDYVAINYIVYKMFGFPLYVAGGVNLNVFPIGKLFRKSGCFFIRRTFARDILYKLSFEAYLYYLLRENKPIEFFFEGGRSRTGRLMSPRFGLYQMLLETHSLIPEEIRKPLKFIPVSIVHEHVVEQKTMANELEEGTKKKKESFWQIIKGVQIFIKQLGSVHIRLGIPVESKPASTIKEIAQNLAFECFRTVSKNMVITPSSMITLIMLDEPAGAMKWDEIMARTKKIIEFCQKFSIPFTDSLKPENQEEAMLHAIDLLIANKKINVFGRTRYGQVFYSIKEECRIEILYAKNTIIHHFLQPWIINLAWLKIFKGQIETFDQLRNFLINQRNQFKYEFYLPSIDEFLERCLKILSDATGKNINSFDQNMEFSHKDLYNIATEIGIFSRGCSYLYEGYYVATQAIKSLAEQEKMEFNTEEFANEFMDIFKTELAHRKIVKYLESRSITIRKNCLKYFEHEGIIENDVGKYKIINMDKLEKLSNYYASILADQLMFRMRALT